MFFHFYVILPEVRRHWTPEDRRVIRTFVDYELIPCVDMMKSLVLILEAPALHDECFPVFARLVVNRLVDRAPCF